MASFQIHVGSNLDVLPTLPDNSVDSIVTDPPYELGFMGKSWDSTGIAYNVEMWRECLRVLKPGGHLLAFSGSRTYHRMTVAIEDAGFQIRDQIMWVYGSGFPKSHNIGNDIDKRMGHPPRGRAVPVASTNLPSGKYADEKLTGNKVEAFVAKSLEAKPWEGWGTALKPAHEPICLARKPLEGTVAQNVLKWGVGGLNINGCRVGTDGGTKRDGKGNQPNDLGWENMKGHKIEKLNVGRWPANLMHDGSQQVLDLFPKDEASSPARFFYCSKASKADRDEGCDELPTQEKPAHMRTANGTGEASMTDGFQPTQRKNTHPTVKPTELMAYLCRLITPPNGTILDPFMGSGSTGRGAIREGFNFIGIELSAEYAEIAKARIEAS